jgi:hypothetical protein
MNKTVTPRNLSAELERRKKRLSGTKFAQVPLIMSSLVRLLGFTTLGCGCLVGRYREVATSREVTYVEEKGKACASHGHRRNHTVSTDRLASAPAVFAAKAF